METAAIIIVAGAAVLGAAAAFAVAWLLRNRVAYPLYWFAVAGALVSGLITASVVDGWGTSLLRSDEHLTAEQIFPNMREIRRSDAHLAERIDTSIIRDQQDGKSAEEVRTNAKALVSSYVADKVPFLEDDLVNELYTTTRDILTYLLARGDVQTCADIALGHYRGDIDPKLSPELVERNNNTIVRVIAAKANKDAPRLTAQAFGDLANEAFGEASQIAGVAPGEVAKLLAGEGDPAKTCKVMKGFIDHILTQPTAVAAAALRTLAAGGPRPA